MTDITERLRELSKARWDRDAWERETTVRIPAEPDRDIDLVLASAAELIDRLRARVAELEAADGECFTAMLVEIDGHAYGLRPGAARIVREALRDAGRIDWIARMSKTSTVYMDNQHPWNVACNYRFNNLRGQTFRDAIDAAMAKDGA